MNNWILVMQVLLIILVLVALLYFKYYVPKYLSTKGANQATKEDIGEITEIVETIKSDLNQRADELKAQLSLVNQHKLTMKAAEIDAFFEYNKALSNKIYYLVKYTIPHYKIEEYEKVFSVFKEFDSRSMNLDLAESHLFLFYRDEIFMKLKGDLHLKVIELEDTLNKYLYEIEKLLRESYFKSLTQPANKPQIMEQMYTGWNKAGDEWRKSKVSLFGEIHKMHYAMMELIYTRLSNIEEQVKKI